MGNRSNINLVGNTTFGQNVGTGIGVYKGKDLGNVLQYKTLSVTGTTMSITSDADNIYFSAATVGGGTGLTTSSNGLTDNGTTVCLGGTLTQDTCIDGDTNTYGVKLCNVSGFYMTGFTHHMLAYSCGCLDAAAGSYFIRGCGVEATIGALDFCVLSSSGAIKMYAPSDAIRMTGGTNGIYMSGLPAKTSETCVVYINASGKLSTGVGGGGGGSSAGVSGDTQFSDGSSGFVVTNSGIARNVDLGSYVLGVSNYSSGTTYSLILGEGNEACDTFESFIGGYYNCHAGGFFPGLDIIYGENNCDLINGYGNAIFGSYNCLSCSNIYNIVAGSNNYVYCGYSSAVFGDSNEICSGGTYALVAGQQNCVLCDAGYVMVLGDNNRMCSDFAYILGSYNFIERCAWNSTALNWNNCVCYCVRGAMAHGNLSVAEVAHERTTGAGKFYYTEPNLVNHRTNTREINFFHQTTGTTDTRNLLTYYCHHPNPATRQCEHFPLTSGSTLAFKAQIVGQRLSDGLSGSWFFEGVVKRNIANTVTFIGTPTVTCYLDTGFTGCACICANNTDKRLDLAVTGMTSTSIGWSATLWGTQVTKL